MRRTSTVALLAALAACAGSGGRADESGPATGVTVSTSDETGGTESETGFETQEGTDTESGTSEATAETGDPECPSPDVLVVLDRTQSMHRTPAGDTPANDAAGQMSSKWWLAITAIEAFTAKFDGVVRFGIELFPLDPQDGSCVTLEQRLAGTSATNPDCQKGEQLVAPAQGTGDAIDQALDPLTTLLCNTTPIGKAVASAGPFLEAVADPDREQFLVLVSDGAETCDSMPVTEVQDLALKAIKTYVVGFGDFKATKDHAELNNLACAGMTAPDFDQSCVDEGGGRFVAVDPDGATLYVPAEDGMALEAAFDGIAEELCCGLGCIP